MSAHLGTGILIDKLGFSIYDSVPRIERRNIKMVKSRNNPDYSREREFKVILEDLRSQFRTFGEGMDAMRSDVSTLKSDVSTLKSDVSILKSDVSILRSDVFTLKIDVADLKLNMAFVRKVLPTLATKDDLLVFDKRLKVLESTAR